MFTRPGTRRNAFSKVSVDALVEAEGSCAFQATDTPQVTIDFKSKMVEMMEVHQKKKTF